MPARLLTTHSTCPKLSLVVTNLSTPSRHYWSLRPACSIKVWWAYGGRYVEDKGLGLLVIDYFKYGHNSLEACLLFLLEN